MTTDQLSRVRAVVRHFSLQEKLYLLNDLTMQVIQQSAHGAPAALPRPLPSIHLATWPTDLPLRREELYDDRGR